MTQRTDPNDASINNPNDDAMMFAYIDQELSAEDAASFERAIMRDPALRDRYESLIAMNEGLERIVDPVSTSATRSLTPGTTPNSISVRPNVKKSLLWASLAASIVIVGVLVVQMSTPSAPGFTPKTRSPRLVSALSDYTLITFDFEPQIVCDTPEKFTQYTIDCFEDEIGAQFDTGVTLVGWRAFGGSYDVDEPSPSRRVLLALSPTGSKIITYFIPEGLDAPTLDLDRTLTSHERTIGSVRIIEITPELSPSVLPILIDPAMERVP